MARRVDQAQNRILALTINRDDTAIRPIRRGRHPICHHAFASEIRPNALAERVIANWGDKANRRAAARRDDRLIGTLPTQIFRGSESHDRFTGRGNLSTRIKLSTAALPITWIILPRFARVSARDARRRRPVAGSRSRCGRSCAGPCHGASGAARNA
jgi:hypothetical protein